MTENEAIKVMKWYSEEEYGKGLVSESHRMAIQALEEIQAIKNIINDFALDCGSTVADIEEIWHQLRKYLKIGTVEEFKALKEKNEPKKSNSFSGCVHNNAERDWDFAK